MIKYTVNDNLNFAFSGSDLQRSSDDLNSKSFKRPLGNRDQRLKSNDSCSETADTRLMRR